MAGSKNEVKFGETYIRRIPTRVINIYEVKESELNELERGTASDLYLEIALSCLSVSVSFVISLCTCEFPESSRNFDIFVVVAVITGIASVVLFLLWFRFRKSRKSVIEGIRSNDLSRHQNINS